MNGLLHRMAARAAGTSVAVRSDAGLPYSAGGSGAGGFGEAEAHVPTAAAPDSQVPSAPATHEHERSTRPVDPADLPAVLDSARAPPPLAAALTDAAAMRATPTTALNARIATRVVSTQPAAFDELPSTIAPLHTASLGPHLVPAVVEAGSAAPVRSATRSIDPAPLMPREARPASLSPVAQPSARRGALPRGLATATSDDNTEVHIHIGRIDVTAVHEAPPSRRRAAAPPAPISLDGYLAQRGRS